MFTRAAYLDAPQMRGALFGLVQAMLLTKHMLFVGYSLRDEDFHGLVHDVRRALPRSIRNRTLGTALTLFEDAMRAELWDQDVDVVATRPQGHSDAHAARDVELLLDLVGFLAADRAAFLLDPDYAGMLTGEERALAALLDPLCAAVAPDDGRDGWSDLAGLLEDFGRSS